LVGFDASDDAAVYQIDSDTAMIQTVDFFPPMVDDPRDFGRVAASNALSDVYAMGGSPRLAMNLLCFPSCLPLDAVREILAGGAEKVREAGAVIAGGHSIEDREPKYGLCVTGFAHPSTILTNGGAGEGDLLVLTKPLGSGVLTTAAKAGLLDEHAYRAVVDLMATLNKAACEAMLPLRPTACTDVTGFGLLGHVEEMARGAGLTARLTASAVPVAAGALELAQEGIIPAGAYRNRDYLLGKARVDKGVPLALADLLYDPQTAGGLVIAIPEARSGALLRRLAEAGVSAAVIGEMARREEFTVTVR
jgi:selenide,water dikinase